MPYFPQPALLSINVSAGTQSSDLTNLVFSNSNGVTFGLSNRTITASAAGAASINFSAGTTSNLLSAITFSNSNGVSFGLNGSTITASAAGGGVNIAINGDTTYTSGTVIFSNSNGVTFGTNAQTVTASVATSLTNIKFSAGSTSNLLSALTLADSNNVSFGLNGSVVTATVTVASTQDSINVSAGATSNNLSAITFADSNGISFGLTGSVITATVQTNYLTTAMASDRGSDFVQATAVFNGTNASGTVASGAISVNVNLLSMQDSATTLPVTKFVFSNANNVSFGFGTAGSIATVTATATVASTQGSILISAGTTSNTGSQFVFSNVNNVSFGLNGSTVTATATVASTQGSIVFSAGTTSTTGSKIVFSNANNVSFGQDASTITATVTVASTQGSIVFSAGTTSTTGSQIVFSNANNVSFGQDASTITATITVPNFSVQDSATTLAVTKLIFSNANNVSFGFATAASLATVTATATVASSLTNIKFSAGTSSTNLSAITFSNSNGVSFGLNGSTVTAQHALDFAAAGVTNAISDQIIFSNSNNVSFGLNGSTFTATATISAIKAFGASNTGNTAGNTGVSTGIDWVLAGSNAVTISESTVVGGPNTLWFSAGNTASTFQAGISNLGNTSGSSGMVSQRLVLVGSNGITLSASTEAGNNSATVTIMAAPLMSYWMNVPNWGPASAAQTQNSGSSIQVAPFFLPLPISLSYMRFLASYNDSAIGTAGTTSANQTYSAAMYTTVGLVIYSQGAGASSRSIRSLTSTSGGMTFNYQYGAGAQGSQYTVTLSKSYLATGGNALYTSQYAVSSASIVISSNSNTLFTGPRFLDIPFAISLNPGNYWLGFGRSTSSTSNSSHISFAGTANCPLSIYGVSQSNLSVGLPGTATSASEHGLLIGLGVWTTNSSTWSTASIAVSQVSQVVSNPQLVFQMIRQA